MFTLVSAPRAITHTHQTRRALDWKVLPVHQSADLSANPTFGSNHFEVWPYGVSPLDAQKLSLNKFT